MKKSILFAAIATTYLITIAFAAPNRNGGTNADSERAPCKPNQYRKADKACANCPTGAERCFLKGVKVTIASCVRGKYVKSDNTCAACTAGCSVCKGANID